MNHSASTASRNVIRFLLDGQPVEATGIEPSRTVLSYLREDLRRCGTKEGCAEGDCGACTVVVGELCGDEVKLKTVNACIQFVPALDGKALITVEDVKQKNGTLHPAQQAMVDCHGSQCGFCTPGFVMSLWNVYQQHQPCGTRPDRAELRSALTGNLCRCTGYRPILEAGERMFDYPPAGFDRQSLVGKLQALQRAETLVYEHQGRKFIAPTTLDELARLRAENPQATLLAGCTDIGLWVNKQFRELGDIIYLGNVAQLTQIEQADGWLTIGAGATLTDAYVAIERYYPQVHEMWERFASVPIRNAGTLGGNVANGSPIGDSMPWLIAVGARVVLRNAERARSIPLEDLYLAYMKRAWLPDEFVQAVEIPLPQPGVVFRTYKLSKRYDSDISAVCAAFALRLEGSHIAEARVAYGGMAATPKRASQTESALAGRPWNETTARAAMATLASDYAPLTDMRASAGYRLSTAQNLLYRFYLETRVENALPTDRVTVFA